MTDGFERPHVKAGFLGHPPSGASALNGRQPAPSCSPRGFLCSALRAFSNRETEAHAKSKAQMGI